MQNVERHAADRHLLAFLQPPVGRHIARAGQSVGGGRLFQIVEQKPVRDMRPFQRHAELCPQLRRAPGMIDMAMGEENALDPDAGFRDRLTDQVEIAAGIDHDPGFGGLVPDEGAVLLERRHRNDHDIEAIGV